MVRYQDSVSHYIIKLIFSQLTIVFYEFMTLSPLSVSRLLYGSALRIQTQMFKPADVFIC